jgi:hypothetical protein
MAQALCRQKGQKGRAMMQSLLRILIAKDSNEFFIGYEIHSERSAMFNHVNYNDVFVDGLCRWSLSMLQR